MSQLCGTLTQPDVEKIISLNPDVVIASIHFSEEAKRQLEDIGIKVVILFEEHKMDSLLFPQADNTKILKNITVIHFTNFFIISLSSFYIKNSDLHI